MTPEGCQVNHTAGNKMGVNFWVHFFFFLAGGEKMVDVPLNHEGSRLFTLVIGKRGVHTCLHLNLVGVEDLF